MSQTTPSLRDKAIQASQENQARQRELQGQLVSAETEVDRRPLTAELSRLQNKRLEIQRGLINRDNNPLGTCVACEDPISEKRLEYVPWARCCIDCANLAEATRARPGSRSNEGAAYSTKLYGAKTAEDDRVPRRQRDSIPRASSL